MIARAAAFLAITATVPAGAAFALSWDWQLSSPYDLSIAYDVMDLDPDNHSVAEIAALKKQGVKLICYVSVGTYEKWRPDTATFPEEVLGKTYDDWPDERFLDIRRLDILLPIMKGRFERCASYGFTAIEPDNMDVFDNDSGFPLTEAHGLRYIKALAKMAQDMGLQIGQKNVRDLTPKLVHHLDFAITESCFQGGWCDALSLYTKQGKPVFDAEYTDRPLDKAAACETAARLGYAMIIKDRDLTAARDSC